MVERSDQPHRLSVQEIWNMVKYIQSVEEWATSSEPEGYDV